jgi:hypothetical protein
LKEIGITQVKRGIVDDESMRWSAPSPKTRLLFGMRKRLDDHGATFKINIVPTLGSFNPTFFGDSELLPNFAIQMRFRLL